MLLGGVIVDDGLDTLLLSKACLLLLKMVYIYIETQMSIEALMVKHTSISVRATTNIFLF